MDKILSIIIPVYNVEKYLDLCLNSLVFQLDDDIEVILVDDGSTDNCPQMCDEWAKKDSRIIAVHKNNGGLASARNEGLKYCSGKLVAFIDSDDQVKQNYISSIRANYNKNQSTIAFPYTEVIEVNGETSAIDPYKLVDKFSSTSESVLYLDNNGIFNSSCIKVYLLSELNKSPILRFEEKMEPVEDTLFNCKYFQRVNNVSIIKDSLYLYYKRGNYEETLSHKFWPDLFNKTKKVVDARTELYESFGTISNEAIVKNAKQNVYYVFKCIPNMYRRNNMFSYKKRLSIYREMINWKELKEWIKLDNSNEFIIKQFKILYKLGLPSLMDFVYSIEFWLNYVVLPKIKIIKK